MTRETYPAARAVAPRVAGHFARVLDRDAARAGEVTRAAARDIAAIEAIVDAAFWASLRREENYTPRISLAFLAPEDTPHPLRLERAMPLSPSALARVAPAVERSGIHLGVWRNGNDELAVWGTTSIIPTFCLVVEVAAPGLLVLKHRQPGQDSGKFVNVAVLEGDQIKVVDETASTLPDCPALLASLLGFDSPSTWVDSKNVLVQVAVSMRAHARGGLLLIVPDRSEGWRESIARPIPYALDPPYSELAELMRALPSEPDARSWRDAVNRAVYAIAGLTAVDGATVMTASYDVVAFGAKIMRRKGRPQVDRVAVTEPVEGGAPLVVDPPALGGTRHLSAAQFVQDQPDSVALVASQDGRFTVFAWSPCDQVVHGHRVETLLL